MSRTILEWQKFVEECKDTVQESKLTVQDEILKQGGSSETVSLILKTIDQIIQLSSLQGKAEAQLTALKRIDKFIEHIGSLSPKIKGGDQSGSKN